MAYCAQTDIERRFGATQVAKWADIDADGDATKIANRIASAIVYADVEIDDRLRGGPYTVPFSSPTPATVTRISAELAGVWLFEGRGIHEWSPEGGGEHRLSGIERKAREMLLAIRSGLLALDVNQVASHPRVWTDADDA